MRRSYHLFLLCIGQTTNERVRRVFGSERSPYFVSCCHSLHQVCCAPQTRSLLPDQSELLSNKHFLRHSIDSQEFHLL